MAQQHYRRGDGRRGGTRSVRRLPIGRSLVTRRRMYHTNKYDTLALKVRSIRQIILTDATPNYSEALSWSLDDFSAGGEVLQAAGLYQQYKINMITVRWIPSQTVANVNDRLWSNTVGTSPGSIFEAGWQNGTISTVLDYESTTAASVSDALQYSSLRLTPLVQPWIRVIRPKYKTVVLSDASTNIASNLNNGWLATDTAGLGVAYRGMKMVFSDCKGADPGTLPNFTAGTVLTTVYVVFRKRR